ncbi:MAG: hypothetical protein M3Q29_01335 [Chloroflexota bacterium]|nr:hypothetical protein [Chloroflexota bacterium]
MATTTYAAEGFTATRYDGAEARAKGAARAVALPACSGAPDPPYRRPQQAGKLYPTWETHCATCPNKLRQWGADYGKLNKSEAPQGLKDHNWRETEFGWRCNECLGLADPIEEEYLG